MLLHAPFNSAYIKRFIDLLGVTEPDQLVSGVIVGILHGVIHTPCNQAQWENGVLLGMIWEVEPL